MDQTLSTPTILINQRAFTLVELIVVITILAILGTIGFISLQGYSAKSRDTKRTSDLRTLTTAINVKGNTVGLLNTVSSLPANELTTPSIGGSNATVGTNYRAGTPNFTVLDQNGSIFKDPSSTTDYIIGATTRNGSVFQLAAYLEGGGTNTALVSGTFVSRAPTFTFTGTLFNLSATAATPSSVTLSGADIAKLRVGDTISLSGVTTIPVAPIVITNISPNQLTIGLTSTAYSGTPTLPGIVYAPDVAGLIDAFGSLTGAVVNGGSLLAYNASGGSSVVAFNCGTSTVTGRSPDSTVYQTVIGEDFKCWLRSNLGTPNIATSSTDSTAYGSLYQWGRLTDGHQFRTSATVSTQSTGDIPGNASFIAPFGVPFADWRSTPNDGLAATWGGTNGIHSPCPIDWRLPTQAEWSALVTAAGITNSSIAFSSSLKLTMAGIRNIADGGLNHQGSYGFYWSSSPITPHAYNLNFNASTVNPVDNNNRANGFSVRCVKN